MLEKEISQIHLRTTELEDSKERTRRGCYAHYGSKAAPGGDHRPVEGSHGQGQATGICMWVLGCICTCLAALLKFCVFAYNAAYTLSNMALCGGRIFS